jgi:hypothetical protein
MGRKWANEMVDDLGLRMEKGATFQEALLRRERPSFEIIG